jgi:hypothetical protein
VETCPFWTPLDHAHVMGVHCAPRRVVSTLLQLEQLGTLLLRMCPLGFKCVATHQTTFHDQRLTFEDQRPVR